jgi:glycosyltransferase involved in cell wall biosynthesis
MKELNKPLVYIVLPCYNSEKYLLEQLMSIYNQNYQNWFLIFVNDGSTDSSLEIAKKFTKDYNLEEKVKIISQKNS